METVIAVLGVGLCAIAVGMLAYGLWDLAQILRTLHKYNIK
ncbi:hypothetical protein TARRARE_24 [Escherichia phage vB_Ec_Tarrare]|uniref:Uncharacterized protein n=1 Tax=Escherichia phage vB_Ec_Tarrare TaxID=3032379 RepID=A0AAF0D4T3_9CAUD|nr:hypothetical protein TARRARE_24 [Escherichia phage vB_Ec_Tarrare]